MVLKLTNHAVPCTISIVAAVLIVMISLGVSDPQNAPPGWNKEVALWGDPTFQEGFNSILNISFAFAGNQAFITVMAEMADAGRDFTPALFILQSFAIPTYTIVGAVIYALSGQYTTSPALGSAPVIPAKVAYGVLFPCLLGTSLVFGHTSIKYLFVVGLRRLRAEHEYTRSTRRSWILWIGIGTAYWILAFVLANAIPIFNAILSISSALFVAWFTFGISGMFWLHLHWHEQWRGWRNRALAVLNWGIVLLTLFMNGAGMWASVDSMLADFRDPNVNINGPFTCADNSVWRSLGIEV